jgi:serine/threonine-protein kinase RsbW
MYIKELSSTSLKNGCVDFFYAKPYHCLLIRPFFDLRTRFRGPVGPAGMKHNRYSIRLKSDLEALAGIKRFVSRVAALHGLPGTVRDDITLAVYEGCANVIEHAYADSTARDIEVELEILESEAIIFIYDSGHPFRPPDKSPDVWELIDRGADGGLGLWMIHNLMDEVNFYNRDGLNVLEMKKGYKPKPV